LERIPAHYFVNSTFTATIVTQEVRFRLGDRQASLHGVAASRILARELQVGDNNSDVELFDLSNPTAIPTSTPLGDLEIKTINNQETSLELDRLWLPAHSAVKIASNGENATMKIEFIDPVDNGKIDSRLVWRGDVTLSDGSQAATGIGSRIWQAIKPSLTIDEARINGLIPTPVDISAIEFDRIVSGDQYQSHASAIIIGDIQFNMGGFPGRQVSIREGEMLSFRDLDAQIVNFSLEEKGLRFFLIGSADKANLGFSNRLRDIQPSLLDFIRAWESLTIILSALFTLFLAVLGGMSNGDKKK